MASKSDDETPEIGKHTINESIDNISMLLVGWLKCKGYRCRLQLDITDSCTIYLTIEDAPVNKDSVLRTGVRLKLQYIFGGSKADKIILTATHIINDTILRSKEFIVSDRTIGNRFHGIDTADEIIQEVSSWLTGEPIDTEYQV